MAIRDINPSIMRCSLRRFIVMVKAMAKMIESIAL